MLRTPPIRCTECWHGSVGASGLPPRVPAKARSEAALQLRRSAAVKSQAPATQVARVEVRHGAALAVLVAADLHGLVGGVEHIGLNGQRRLRRPPGGAQVHGQVGVLFCEEVLDVGGLVVVRVIQVDARFDLAHAGDVEQVADIKRHGVARRESCLLAVEEVTGQVCSQGRADDLLVAACEHGEHRAAELSIRIGVASAVTSALVGRPAQFRFSPWTAWCRRRCPRRRLSGPGR